MFTTFQVDWTATSSKTTLTKNFNLKRDRRTNGRTNGRTDVRTNRRKNGLTYERTDGRKHGLENIMPINGA